MRRLDERWHDRGTRPRLIPALLVVAVVLAGCSDDAADSPDESAGGPAAISDLPSCVDDFGVGDTSPEDFTAGCVQPDGYVQLGSYLECGDGRILFTLDDPARWGVTGEPIVASTTPDVAADPGYNDAYETCTA